MMLKIGWKPVSRNPNVASMRIRCLLPMGQLHKKGVVVGFYPGDKDTHYDIVVFNKTHDRKSLEQAKRLKDRGTRVVFDLCDNYFYNPHQFADVEKAKDIILQMMALADVNVASSDYLASKIADYIDRNKIEVIEDPVDELLPPTVSPITHWLHLRRYQRLAELINHWHNQNKTCLVWFGIAGGCKAEYGMGDLKKIQPLLNAPEFKERVTLTVISNNKKAFHKITQDWGVPVCYLPWHPSTFAHALRLHDISVIPISQNPFTLAKTNNRLAQSLYHGLPVIADSIPSYQPFREVCQLDDWHGGLNCYLNDLNKRFADVQAGRHLLLNNWSSHVISEQWLNLFNRLSTK